MAIRQSWHIFNKVHLLACLLCIHGCTTGYQGRQSLLDKTVDLAPVVELTQTPFYPQTEHHCGPAALATVLQAHHIDATPDTLSPQLYIPALEGSLQVEMSAAARRHGMLPYPLKPDFTDLLTEIAAGNPVLVMQNLGFDWWPQWHYAVVVGYDITNDELVLRSGTTKRWQTTFTAFMNTWKRADNWALVIVPAGMMPATAGITRYLESAYAFEQTGMQLNALDAYRAATNTWPDDSRSWKTRGNMAYQVGHKDEAAASLLMATRLDPGDAGTWNNLAYALHRIGCSEQASKSLQCAYQHSADNENIRDSEEEISNMAVQPRTGNCPEISCN